MQRILFCLIVGWLSLQTSGISCASEIWITSDKVPGFPDAVDCNIRLKGSISGGDAKRLAQALSKLRGFANAAPILCLESDGGDFAEAILMIKRMLDSQASIGMHTRVEANKRCLSACAFIFMAGMECVGTAYRCVDSRSMHISSKLGFHAPTAEDIPGVKFDGQTLAAAYKAAVIQMGQLSELFSRRVESGSNQGQAWIRLSLFSELLKREKDSFYYIDTVAKAGFFDIDIEGAPSLPLISKPMMYHACTNLTNWYNGRIGEYNVAEYFRAYSPTLIKDAAFSRNDERRGGTISRILRMSQQLSYKLDLWERCEVSQVLDASTKLPTDGYSTITVDKKDTTLIYWIFFPGDTRLVQLLAAEFVRQAQSATQ